MIIIPYTALSYTVGFQVHCLGPLVRPFGTVNYTVGTLNQTVLFLVILDKVEDILNECLETKKSCILNNNVVTSWNYGGLLPPFCE